MDPADIALGDRLEILCAPPRIGSPGDPRSRGTVVRLESTLITVRWDEYLGDSRYSVATWRGVLRKLSLLEVIAEAADGG